MTIPRQTYPFRRLRPEHDKRKRQQRPTTSAFQAKEDLFFVLLDKEGKRRLAEVRAAVEG